LACRRKPPGSVSPGGFLLINVDSNDFLLNSPPRFQVRCGFPFILFLLLHPFGVMQGFCFYPFSPSVSIWGNAGLLLLPFYFFCIHLGQCSASAFTLFSSSAPIWGNAAAFLLPFFSFCIPFGVMQRVCFYPFSPSPPIWGNAGLLLLPFFSFSTHLGQCRASAFTLFLLLHPFGVMQGFCFYPFSPSPPIWGNAGLLLLPFFSFCIHLG
jgi:hypothetical protein